MTEDEFIQLFPNDEYKEETSAYTWQKEKSILNQIIDTRQSDILNLEDLSLEAGYYKIEVSTKDKDSVPVMQEHIFLLTDQATGNLGFPSYQILLEQKQRSSQAILQVFYTALVLTRPISFKKQKSPIRKLAISF